MTAWKKHAWAILAIAIAFNILAHNLTVLALSTGQFQEQNPIMATALTNGTAITIMATGYATIALFLHYYTKNARKTPAFMLANIALTLWAADMAWDATLIATLI